MIRPTRPRPESTPAITRPGPRPPRARNRAAGFTLIEIVVAFVLLASVLGVGFEIFSTGLRRAGDLGEYSRALVLAQSQIALASAVHPLAEAQTQGETSDRRFRWTTVVARTAEGEAAAGQPPNSNYSLYRIETRVEWAGPDERPRSFTLASLALGPRQ